MTQKEKQLLLTDIYARLSYGFTLYRESDDCIITIEPNDISTFAHFLEYSGSEDFKPYLRPMSSMTKEEKEEVEVFIFNKWYQEDSCKVDEEGWIEILANYDVSGIDPYFCSDYVDWLSAHHFDYRGLIEKGLALEAPKNMYTL